MRFARLWFNSSRGGRRAVEGGAAEDARRRGVPAAAAVVVDRTNVMVTQSLLAVAGITALLVRLGRGWEGLVAFVSLCSLVAAFGLVVIHLQRNAPTQLGRTDSSETGRAAAAGGRGARRQTWP